MVRLAPIQVGQINIFATCSYVIGSTLNSTCCQTTDHLLLTNDKYKD